MVRLAFVSFANGPYLEIQKKLIDSVRKHGYDIFTYNDFRQISSPTHAQSPYMFKIHAIESIRQKGYEIVIWCDSPIRLAKRIESWIPEIEKRGVYLQRDGWAVGQWANDKSLQAFGLTRDQAMTMPNIYACIMAFDFKNPIALTFLKRMKQCSDLGLFRGNWRNFEKTESQDERCLGHRHDQTCAELVANELNIEHGVGVIGNGSYFTTWDN